MALPDELSLDELEQLEEHTWVMDESLRLHPPLPFMPRVTVAEIVPEIIDWATGPMVAMTAGGIDDARTTIHIGDVGALIAASPATFDAILLDVDNGPDGLSRQGNDALYSPAGLARARAALHAADAGGQDHPS